MNNLQVLQILLRSIHHIPVTYHIFRYSKFISKFTILINMLKQLDKFPYCKISGSRVHSIPVVRLFWYKVYHKSIWQKIPEIIYILHQKRKKTERPDKRGKSTDKVISRKPTKWNMTYKMKTYGVNVRETALQPRKKQSILQI